ncbi:MAG: SMP-30/gluconolactonase/LRE family protein [Gemmatimonadota bacterium]|nr:SMP-30/gluconolactonase/LRE family protein [Gemmatimonadota bacterium]
MIPEGIAHDPVDGVFYVGSTWHRNIVRVDGADDAQQEFFAGVDHGVWGIVGMRVDPERRLLWFASSHAGDGMPMIDMHPTFEGRTGLFAVDLETGALRHRTVLPRPGFLNDVVVARDGTVYVTDSAGDAVLRRTDGDDLETFADLSEWGGANGIDITPDERFMFVAVGRGVVRVDMASGDPDPIARDTAIAGVIDGLYFRDGALIVVQPYEAGRYVTRLDLDGSLSTIVREVPILEDHPLIDQPTTAAIVGPDLYVISNSHLQTFRRLYAAGDLEGAAGLTPPTILKVPTGS